MSQVNSNSGSTASGGSAIVSYNGAPVLGQNYIQALEASGGSVTFNGTGTGAGLGVAGQFEQLSVQLRF
jgi:hypothetical protein